MAVKDVESLQVWQKAMALTTEIYLATREFPKDEMYGLISQTRRAAVSVAANIAEGKGRGHRKEYQQFLYTSKGSAYELITLLLAARNVGYLADGKAKGLLERAEEIIAMLTGLIKAL